MILEQMQRPRRFWKQAAVCCNGDAGYGVELDGKSINVASGRPLQVQSRVLAEAIAREWNDQGDSLSFAAMPMTRLASAAVDRMEDQRSALIEGLMDHVHGDVLFYHAADPADLVELQAVTWGPLLAWAGDVLGVKPLTTRGLMPVQQDGAYVAAMRQAITGLTNEMLTVFHGVASGCNSLILALALVRRHIDAATAFDASLLDELYQSSLWGEDHEAVQRRTALRHDLVQMEVYASLLGTR
ncbi:ATPase [Haematospirillum jordaniae]|uniref:ATP12 family chaperone protein n=1 Tax=Haematospirillum jordaniae TaxID=1549855 RepID=UPI001432C992|nr:ATP12 family protein [Haematospirillum jordaniae]NKD44401.1 ATPase [Haematospirillum jordaniae]NKD92282.1 ATPase [Haematospirillum jordaniae]